MDRRSRDLEALETSADAGRAVAGPHAGAKWDEAIALGIDVTLLVRNLQRSPRERIALAASQRQAAAAMQARTVRTDVREAMLRARQTEKVAMLEALVG